MRLIGWRLFMESCSYVCRLVVELCLMKDDKRLAVI